MTAAAPASAQFISANGTKPDANATDEPGLTPPARGNGLVIRIGSPNLHGVVGPGVCPTGHYWNGFRYVRYPWYSDWSGTTTYRYYAPINRDVATYAAKEEEPAPAKVDPSTLPPLERGVLLWSTGERANAITALREHLKTNSNDANAMRTLALVMLDDKRFDDAAGLMRLAYRTDATLAATPIDVTKLGLTTSRTRDLVTAATAAAHKTNSASAWLVVGALMQSEGRDVLAGRMIDRAAKAGLERTISDAFKANLKADPDAAARESTKPGAAPTKQPAPTTTPKANESVKPAANPAATDMTTK